MIPTPPALAEDATHDMVVRLKAGDTSVMQALILGHMQLCQQIAFNYYKRCRGRAQLDDLEAEAMFRLTKSVQNAKTRLHDDEIRRYISHYVSKALLRWLYRNRVIYASKERLIQLRTKYLPLLLSFETDGEADSDDLIDYKEINRQRTKELLQVLHTCIKTKLEKKVLELRLVGIKADEIAIQLGIPSYLVRRIRRRIFKKFRAALGE